MWDGVFVYSKRCRWSQIDREKHIDIPDLCTLHFVPGDKNCYSETISNQREDLTTESIVQAEFTEAVKKSEKSLMVTNTGRPIKNDITTENVFAVYGWVDSGGIEREVLLASDRDYMSNNEIQDGIAHAVDDNIESFDKFTYGRSVCYTRTFYVVKRAAPKMKDTHMSGTLVMKRVTDQADIDGRDGSIWDAKTVSRVSTSKPEEISEMIARIHANAGEGQRMLDFKLYENIKKVGNNPGADSLYDRSSLHKETGKWILKNENKVMRLHVRKMKIMSSARVANTKGHLCISCSISAYQPRPNVWGGTINTGLVNYAFPDR